MVQKHVFCTSRSLTGRCRHTKQVSGCVFWYRNVSFVRPGVLRVGAGIQSKLQDAFSGTEACLLYVSWSYVYVETCVALQRLFYPENGGNEYCMCQTSVALQKHVLYGFWRWCVKKANNKTVVKNNFINLFSRHHG